MHLIAHRGYKKTCEENSMQAFLNAINGYFDGFECDIRQTRDKKFVVYHDPLYKGKYFKLVKYNKSMLLLKNVLKIKTNKMIIIDIKDPFIDIYRLSILLNKYKKNIYVMSFYQNIIKKLMKKKHKYKLGIIYLIHNLDLRNYKYDFLCINQRRITKYEENNILKSNIALFEYNIINKENEKIYYIVD